MSTTFFVFPGNSDLPTFRAVRDLTQDKLHRYLRSLGVDARPTVHVALQGWDDHHAAPFSLDLPFVWPEDQYAWFTIDGVLGGTDADTKPVRLEVADDEFGVWELPFKVETFDAPAVLETARASGRCWSFRRSAGQPSAIVLLYGLLASATAELTHGVVYSEDGAWDAERFPAWPWDFDGWYLRPEGALREELRAWGEVHAEGLRRAFRRT
ncbi:hypothetical protein [Deinococcus pimensis]|uniref:hypothetical protein n=1 Tax=Deinococcus pimensis TaxID=309888 RepID=UPI000488996F|nr:hypothetical protein [Deinococcus pimensis]